MTNVVITDVENFIAKIRAEFAPEVKAVENDVHAIVSDAVTYIKTKGLQDLEQLALIFVSAMVPGASWIDMLAELKTKAIADGIALVEGDEAIVAAKVQADLLVQGKTLVPVASTPA